MELNLSTVNSYGFSKEVYMQTNIISGILDELKISDGKFENSWSASNKKKFQIDQRSVQLCTVDSRRLEHSIFRSFW